MIWHKVRLKFKWGFNDLLTLLGKPYSCKLKGEVRVLCFHGVCEDHQTFINGRFIKKTQLEELLVACLDHFEIISLQQYIDGEICTTKLNVLLTFDDGYENNATILFPILKELNIPATLFITAEEKAIWADLFDIAIVNGVSFKSIKEKFPEIKGMSSNGIKSWLIQQPKETVEIARDQLFDLMLPFHDDYKLFWKLLPTPDLEVLAKDPLLSIANHSSTHVNYAVMSSDEVKEDFEKNKSFISKIGSPFSSVFAYPFGAYSDETISVLSSLDCSVQFGIDGSKDIPKGISDRLVINPFISLRNQLKAIEDGKY